VGITANKAVDDVLVLAVVVLAVVLADVVGNTLDDGDKAQDVDDGRDDDGNVNDDNNNGCEDDNDGCLLSTSRKVVCKVGCGPPGVIGRILERSVPLLAVPEIVLRNGTIGTYAFA